LRLFIANLILVRADGNDPSELKAPGLQSGPSP